MTGSYPILLSSMDTAAGMTSDSPQDDAEQEWMLYTATFDRSTKSRAILAALSLSIWLVGYAVGSIKTPFLLLVLFPALTLVANELAKWVYSSGLLASWHLHAFLFFDAVLIGASVMALGDMGYLGGPFYIVAASAYGLGVPRAARFQVAIGCLIYPFTRYLGVLAYGGSPSLGLITMESVALAGLGWLAIQGPVRSTFRLRRARRGLRALEEGNFSVRLPTRALDDLGLLAVSFNSTAETLGSTVAALRSEISERERVEAELAYQAFHDTLTGLANRALFRDRVAHALARDSRQDRGVAVLFLDLDNFKSVNDSMGHAEGDRLLVAAANRLLNATRGGDTVARLGGDEFAVLLENVYTDESVIIVAERILGAFSRPVSVNGRDAMVTTSIGIARSRVADTTDELLRNADVAMYRAKHGGKGTYELFAPEMYDALIDRLQLENDLGLAMHRGEFSLVYQPIIELSSQKVIGAEALLRWEHPTRGTIPPLAFIPVAEENGMIVELGRWVLVEACRQGAHWCTMREEERERELANLPGSSVVGPLSDVEAASSHVGRAGDVPLSITVNISGRQLQHADFVEHVRIALADSGLTPACLVLEITESVIIQETEITIQRLNALKALGVRLAIDDFGTGYSSLGYLQKFPVDILKIDKTFIDSVGRGGEHAALARTILALGEMLSLRCVAEGIENGAQRQHLLDLGCELGQGYLFARPLHPSMIEPLFAGVGGAPLEAVREVG